MKNCAFATGCILERVSMVINSNCHSKDKKKKTSPGGLEPPTFRLTAERANRLRHGDILEGVSALFLRWNPPVLRAFSGNDYVPK